MHAAVNLVLLLLMWCTDVLDKVEILHLSRVLFPGPKLSGLWPGIKAEKLALADLILHSAGD